MRRTMVFALMTALLLLSGCGAKAEETAVKNFQQELTAAGSVAFTADVRCEYEDRTESYTFDFEKTGGDAAVKVTKPELIAGICAHISEGGSKIRYDGAELDTGELPGGLAPVTVLPTLAETLAGGHLDLAWREGDAAAAQFTPADGLTVTVWFDKNMNPFHAELQSSGKVTAYCDIINFTFS